jgi:heterogeneous nuclear rnp K-like protein 2
MPDADSNRKRSRSPSDSEPPKQHKRANTGNTTNTATNNDSTTTTSRNKSAVVPGSVVPSTSMTHDVTMSDEPASALTSTPSPKRSTSESKSKSERAQDSASNAGDNDELGKSSAATSAAPSSSTSAPAPSAMIHMRCLIVTQDASIIIGKGGSHVNEIREKSGARVMVSESIPGNPERILNVSGPLDAVSKVSETKRSTCCAMCTI